jgi:hypothetical protein
MKASVRLKMRNGQALILKQKRPELMPRRADSKKIWRRDPESNWANRICNPGHNRFAIAPKTDQKLEHNVILLDHASTCF